MYEYTIEAYDDTPVGRVNGIKLIVSAKTEDDAIKRARAIKARTSYAVVGIKELENTFKKG